MLLNFNQFLKLNESLNSAKEKYSSQISLTDFEKLKSFDFTKTFKYLEALCKFFLEEASLENLEVEIKTYDDLLTKNKFNTRDINKLNYSQFKEEIKQGSEKLSQSNQIKKSESDVHFILDNENLLIVVPDTWEASKKYGSGTKWCTTEKNNDSYFKNYRYEDDLTLYYILDKKNLNSDDPMYKVVVTVDADGKIVQCFNALDKEIKFEEVLQHFNLDKSLFKHIEIKDPFLRLGIDMSKATNNSDGTYDYDGNLDFSNRNLKSLKDLGIQFRNVSGDFDCYDNQLTTLEFAPKSVSGGFHCGFNQLTTLEFAPKSVGGNFECDNNKLITLEGAPNSVGRDFICSFNKLTTLEFAPKSVSGGFYCSYNQLTTLEGAPNSVTAGFYCSGNQLTTLEGAPKSVDGSFYCNDNKLTTLEFAPKSVGGNFYCSDNEVKFTEENVRKVSDVKGSIYN